jgi:hypothetical protein
LRERRARRAPIGFEIPPKDRNHAHDGPSRRSPPPSGSRRSLRTQPSPAPRAHRPTPRSRLGPSRTRRAAHVVLRNLRPALDGAEEEGSPASRR